MAGGASRLIVGIVAAAAIGAVTLTAAVAWVLGPRPTDEPLPVYGEVPAFELVSQHEQPVTLADLSGKVWVAEFIFTRCAGICPIMVRNMAAVHDALAGSPHVEDLRLVSFSVDPEHDTPAVLRDYAREHGAQSERWLFLTAEQRDPIWRLSHEGFMLGVSEAPENPLMPINHSGKFVLVDRAGQIRGYYSGTTAEDRADLVADIKRLLRQ